MMRCLTTDQRILYQRYAKLGEEIKKFEMLDNNLKNESIWKIISREGVWKLPIAAKYGGKGLGWEECLIALDGFFSECFDTELVVLFISHVSSLYLISKYGTNEIKNNYLPRLTQGDMGELLISKHIHPLLADHFNKERNKVSRLNISKVHIHITKIKRKIIASISEIQLTPINSPVDDKIREAISVRDNILIPKEIGKTVLCDIINFERLFYGIFSANFAKMVINK